MTVETLQILSIVGYILAGLFFILSVVLFFSLKVPKLVSDLTGRTERKAIAAIRQQSEQREDNILSGNTDKITKSGLLSRQEKTKGKATAKKGIRYGNVVTKPGNSRDSEIPTAPLPHQHFVEDENLTTALRRDEPLAETSILSESAVTNETTILSELAANDETTILSEPVANDETTILSEPVKTDETTVLSQSMTGEIARAGLRRENNRGERKAPAKLVVEVDLFFVESKELIE